MKHYIALADCDCFFVSAERAFNPKLEGRAVAVLSNNDGCVVSRSKEAKALGLKMGEPYFMAKKEFPDVLYCISAQFDAYCSKYCRLLHTPQFQGKACRPSEKTRQNAAAEVSGKKHQPEKPLILEFS